MWLYYDKHLYSDNLFCPMQKYHVHPSPLSLNIYLGFPQSVKGNYTVVIQSESNSVRVKWELISFYVWYNKIDITPHERWYTLAEITNLGLTITAITLHGMLYDNIHASKQRFYNQLTLPLPIVIIHSLKSSLLLGKSPSSKDWFKVHPLPLDLVQVVQVLVKISQSLLPHRGLVLKALIVWRILQRLQQALIVTNLIYRVFGACKFKKIVTGCQRLVHLDICDSDE